MKRTSLVDYVAAKRAVARPCAVCKLEQRREIEDGRAGKGLAKPMTYPEIVDALRAVHSVVVTEDRLRFHFRQKHHEKDAN